METMSLTLGGEAASRSGDRPWRGPERVLLALADCLLPDTDAVPRAAERTTEHLLQSSRRLAPLSRLLFFLGLRILDWSPVLLLRAPSRLSRLPRRRRRELFDRWLHSRIYLRRQLGIAYNGTLFLSYYDLPEARALLSYGVEAHVARSKAARAGLLARDAVAGLGAPRGRCMIRS